MQQPKHLLESEEYICLFCDECFLLEEGQELICPKCGSKKPEAFMLNEEQKAEELEQ